MYTHSRTHTAPGGPAWLVLAYLWLVEAWEWPNAQVDLTYAPNLSVTIRAVGLSYFLWDLSTLTH